jgi:hypothetical protein
VHFGFCHVLHYKYHQIYSVLHSALSPQNKKLVLANPADFSHGDSKSAGVSVMFRNGFDFKVNDSILDQNGRYIILDLTV